MEESGQLHAPGKQPGTHWIGEGVGPRAGFGQHVEKKLLVSDPSVVKPVAGRYTD
jgi:hypothetical protein